MEMMKEKSTAAAITVRQSSSHSGSAGRGGREGQCAGRGPRCPPLEGCPGRLSSRQALQESGCESNAHTHTAATVWQGLYRTFSLCRLVTLLQKGQEAQGV